MTEVAEHAHVAGVHSKRSVSEQTARGQLELQVRMEQHREQQCLAAAEKAGF